MTFWNRLIGLCFWSQLLPKQTPKVAAAFLSLESYLSCQLEKREDILYDNVST
jgi:hypothetical protein